MTRPLYRASASPPRRHRFGQHFLEAQWVDKVVRSIDPRANQIFIEIGPGRGALTHTLAERARAVLAFEIDRDLVSTLNAAASPRLKVLSGDFLEVTAERLRTELQDLDPQALDSHALTLRVAGNLPYNVASPILFKLVDLCCTGVPFADATVMLQREVANRLLARPGTREYGVLTILIGRHATPTLVVGVPPGAFRPPPKVHSSLVSLVFHAPHPPVRDEGLFTALVQALFTQRRKTLGNALLPFRGDWHGTSPRAVLGMADLDASRRPETLTPGELATLADVLTLR